VEASRPRIGGRGTVRFEAGPPPVVVLAGEVDIALVGRLSTALHQALADRTVVVEAADLWFVDSAAIRCLVRVSLAGNRVVVRHAPDRLRSVVQMLDLGRLLELDDP
jgi:anti-anti-sigma regulatory factor